jgi:hypothetical protein
MAVSQWPIDGDDDVPHDEPGARWLAGREPQGPGACAVTVEATVLPPPMSGTTSAFPPAVSHRRTVQRKQLRTDADGGLVPGG